MMTAGKAIYRDQCSACHGIDGNGVPQLFSRRWPIPPWCDLMTPPPPDTNCAAWRSQRSDRAEPTLPGMPSYGWQLDDAKSRPS